jgi:hypothetical protein
MAAPQLPGRCPRDEQGLAAARAGGYGSIYNFKTQRLRKQKFIFVGVIFLFIDQFSLFDTIL